MAVAACVVTVARRPDALFHSQFWAEDGTIFFQQAWNNGAFNALATTYQGYLEELPRLVAIPAVAIGLRRAPLLFNLVALAFQVAPAIYFVSDRCESLVKSRTARVVVAAIYLLLPNAEIDVNLANVQWHLALLAFLTVVATPARHLWAQILEGVVIFLAVLTGPFGLLLVPVAGIWYWRHRLPITRVHIAAATIGTVLQMTASLVGPGRPHAALGASVERFLEIVANRVFLAGSFAQDQNPEHVITNFSDAGLAGAVAIVVVGSAIAVFALWRGPWALKLFIVFATAIFVGGLFSPAVTSGDTAEQWPGLVLPAGGGRYFFMAELAWLLSLIWLFTRLRSKAVGAVLVGIVCLGVASGVAHEWSYPAYSDLHPNVYAAALKRAEKGHIVTVAVNPTDLGYANRLEQAARGYRTKIPPLPVGSWRMRLVAH